MTPETKFWLKWIAVCVALAIPIEIFNVWIQSK